jgi:hypothetical protein
MLKSARAIPDLLDAGAFKVSNLRFILKTWFNGGLQEEKGSIRALEKR